MYTDIHATYIFGWQKVKKKHLFKGQPACVFLSEVGKNINQDLSLRMKRFVEDYHKYVESLHIPTMQPKTGDRRREGQGGQTRKGNLYYSSGGAH